MKYPFVFLICLLSIQQIKSQIQFPKSNPEKGYELSEVHARMAFPIDGQHRIWVKGSEKYPRVKVIYENGQGPAQELVLEPPFYTGIINVNPALLKITFCNAKNDCTSEIIIDSRPYDNIQDGNFSFMVYGCLEPFHINYDDEGKPESELFVGEFNSAHNIRTLFQNVAIQETIRFNDSVNKKWDYVFNGQFESTLLKSPPKCIITTGDQVYVDAGYAEKMPKGVIHPISAWETKRRPKPFDPSLSHYKNYLNKLYNASYSFVNIETAHRALPTLSTIDDHELRDGWGSQGDEYENGIMNPELAGHYQLGKQAFIEHQLALSNFPKDKMDALLTENATMNYAFEVNGKNGYVFDLRSARNINKSQLLGENQWNHFEKWLAQLEPNQEIILVTSVPVTLRPLKWIEDVYKLFKPELRDDVRDGWSSRKNQEERNRLINLLTTYRIAKDIKPILVSGDIHKSALIEIWVDPYVGRGGKHDTKESMVLGYEVVASGLSHEFLKSGISKSIFKLLESQRIGDGLIDFTYNGNKASIYPMVWNSIVAENFAAIEFSETEPTKLHSFIFNSSTETLEQRYLELDFNKKQPNEDYFEITQGTNGKSKTNFKAPVPDVLRVILEQPHGN